MFNWPKEVHKWCSKEFGGHKDEVNSVAFSPDFEIMVTGSDDERVRVFNTKSKQMICKLKGHSGAVKTVAVSANSKYIASGSYDKSVLVWVTRSATQLHKLEGHSKSIEVVVFSPDSTRLCSGSWDRTAILWDIQSGQAIKEFKGHTGLVQSIAFSHCGKWLRTILGKQYYSDNNTSVLIYFSISRKATGSWDHTVRVWEIRDLTADHVMVLTSHRGNIHAVAFSKEGMLASGSWDKTVKLWNPRNGRLLHTLMGHKGWVQALSFSPDGCFLASAGDDESVRLWDVVTTECLNVLEGETDIAQQCGFKQNGILVAAGAAFLPLNVFQ